MMQGVSLCASVRRPETPPLVRASVAALGYMSVLVGERVLPLGIDELRRVAMVVALVLAAGTCALMGRRQLALTGGVLSLSLVSLSPDAGGLAAGLCYWLWFRSTWSGAGVLAGFSVLLWLRSFTNWPDTFLGWCIRPISWITTVPAPSLGVSATGLWLTVGALLVVAVRGRSLVLRRWLLCMVGVISAVYVAWRTLSLTRFVDHEAIGLFTPLWLLGVALAVPVAISADSPKSVKVMDRRGLVVATAIALAFLPLSMWFAHRTEAPGGPVRVAFLNEGGLDWYLPKRATPLGGQFGMFGALPIYLEQDGWSVEAVEIDAVERGRLADFDVLVTINNPRVWTTEQRAAVDIYLRAGGALLVLGDHTDVFGCKKGFDSLLEPYGITFAFDSAYHARDSWTGCALAATHPAFSSGEGEFVLAHAIGASLTVNAGVEPLILGRFAFSDQGVRENKMGAFLGNYRYRAGEEVGDLMLAAWVPVGKGRIVAYGDTSAFQSGSLVHSYRSHVLPLMRWLACPGVVAEQLWYRLLLSILVLGAIWSAVRGRSAPSVAVSTAASLCVAAMALFGMLLPVQASLKDKILVDDSLGSWTGHYAVKMNSTGPLYANLARSGLRALAGQDLQSDLRRMPRGVVVVAPTERISEAQTAQLLDYLSLGGAVLIAAGLESRSALLPLINALGLDIGPTPLGVTPSPSVSGPERLEPRTCNGWPLLASAATRSKARDLFRCGAHTIALAVPVGAGQLVWIGDGRFFSTANIEDTDTVWPGNIMFLERLFAMLFRGDAGSVVERFQSPEKPQ